MKSFVVAKFGGTSMGNAQAMKKCAQIVCDNPKIKVVVVSATSGTTNQLIKIYESAVAGATHDQNEKLAQLKEKHNLIAKELLAPSEVINDLSNLYLEGEDLIFGLKSIKEKSALVLSHAQYLDQVLSLGERISSLLFNWALCASGKDAKLFDVRRILITDNHFGKAEPNILQIEKRCAEHLQEAIETRDAVVVLQGFIGATVDGQTTTLGRGGSDYSAALLAEGLQAEGLQIWTDVPGIMTMDPNIVKKARVIPRLSFNEAAELANFGAKVLHPATVWPAVRKNINVFVGSTFQPTKAGTWIFPAEDPDPRVRAIALRKRQTLITVTSLRMLNTHGFLARLFSILAQYELSIDLVSTSEVSVALTVDGASIDSSGRGIDRFSAMFADLGTFCEVRVEEGLTLVAIVGNGLNKTLGLSSRTFNAIAKFDVRLICHGASSHNLCFLVGENEGDEVANLLHAEFIEKAAP